MSRAVRRGVMASSRRRSAAAGPLVLVQKSPDLTAGVRTSFSITPGSAPTTGNLLILPWFMGADPTTRVGPSGYTLAVTTPNATNGTSIYYRVADGTEGTSPISGSGNSALQQAIWYEFSVGVPWAASPVDVTGTAGTTAATTIAVTGSTSMTQARELIVTAIGWAGATSAPSFNNGYATEDSNTRLAVGRKEVVATETVTTTASWTTSQQPRHAIAAFKIPA